MRQLYTILAMLVSFTGAVTAQNNLEFKIDEVIELAKEQ